MKEQQTIIYFAGGCFWGTQHFMKQIHGVISTEVGFANGNSPNPTYLDVCHHNTGHVETVKVLFNPSVVSVQSLLQLFFLTIDPTSVNKQGGDYGTQYRTGIYYTDDDLLPLIENEVSTLAKQYLSPLALEVKPLENFYPADASHQDYLEKNPSGYCHLHPNLFRIAREANSKQDACENK